MKKILEILFNIFFLNYIFYCFFCILFFPFIIIINVYFGILKTIKSLSYQDYLINKNTILDTKKSKL